MINHYFWQKYLPRQPIDFPDTQCVSIGDITKYLLEIEPHPVLLSGGLDSSIIAAVTRRKCKSLQSFTLTCGEDSYDEFQYAKTVSDFLDLHSVYWKLPRDVDYLIEEVFTDEPFGDSSVVAMYYLSKKASDYTDIVNSGDGSDEIFGGYDVYRAYQIAKWLPSCLVKLISKIPIKHSDDKVTLGFKVKRFCRDYGVEAGLRHLRWMGTFGEEDRKKLLGSKFIPDSDLIPYYGNSLDDIQECDQRHYLSGCGVEKIKYASQASGLKIESPLLGLANVMNSLPQKYKVRGLTTKWLLKRIAKHFLPKAIVNRKKRGFTVPLSLWIKRSDLIKKHMECGPELNGDYVKALYSDHISGKADNARKLWLVFTWNYSKAKKDKDVKCLPMYGKL